MKIQRKTNLKVILILLFLSPLSKVIAQQDQYNLNSAAYTLSSPEVSSFEKYSLNEINQYTGKAGISVPVYTIRTGNIEYPISLVYNSGGIKVDQIASDVGLGWNLTSSMITRTINQGNDFDYDDNTRGFFVANHDEVCYGYGVNDLVPDTYHFYCNGFSTSFFFNDVNTPVELNPQGTKIQATSTGLNITTNRGHYNNQNVWVPTTEPTTNDFFSIVITTNDGVKYTFSDCDYGLTEGDGQIGSPTNVTPAHVSAWHITKIEDLKTGKKIDFVYDNTSSNAYHPANSQSVMNTSVAQRSFHYYSGSYADGYSERIFGSSIKTDVQKKRLVKILFDGGEVDFNYNNNGIAGQTTIVRNDLYNADCVTQIYLKDKSAVTVNSYEFTYDYFTSASDGTEFNPEMAPYLSTYRYKRLKLLKFGEIGKPKYKFTYDESVNFPPINSFSIDFLGYYNHSLDATMATSNTTQNPITPNIILLPQ